MDPAVRRHIKLQIDAAARKREGLASQRVRRSTRPAAPKSRRWADGEIIIALRLCAKEIGVPRSRLTLAQYRAWRNGTTTNCPNPQTVQDRLGSKRLP